ncbi:hypothetical protein LPW26_19900 [Rhodopseudomonas sp. HC1]|uniref:DUF2946 family protein n=1 Tax=Rhodopseudomonas infernalis TaxID=2897386 RepID=UPI001EE7DAA8|nr:DUF2946 family protein [Rhodopseudomonas infernalis]MCG6206914.1 hypothetical protein [Rhodopseudomonas infernalis]
MIPVFALALLVQLLSPIGAIRFVAAAAADPLATAHLCSAMASDEGGGGASGLPHDGGCCTICAVGLGGAPAPAAAPPAHATIERTYQSFSWPHREPEPPAQRLSAHAQPRAPPGVV